MANRPETTSAITPSIATAGYAPLTRHGPPGESRAPSRRPTGRVGRRTRDPATRVAPGVAAAAGEASRRRNRADEPGLPAIQPRGPSRRTRHRIWRGGAGTSACKRPSKDSLARRYCPRRRRGCRVTSGRRVPTARHRFGAHPRRLDRACQADIAPAIGRDQRRCRRTWSRPSRRNDRRRGPHGRRRATAAPGCDECMRGGARHVAAVGGRTEATAERAPVAGGPGPTNRPRSKCGQHADAGRTVRGCDTRALMLYEVPRV